MIYIMKTQMKSLYFACLSIFNLPNLSNTQFLNKNIVEKILKFEQIALILHSQRETCNGEY